jgi:hypothetical protein
MEMNISKQQLNKAVTALAKLDRPAAVAILARFNASNTVELKHEDVPAAHAAFLEALKKFGDSQ